QRPVIPAQAVIGRQIPVENAVHGIISEKALSMPRQEGQHVQIGDVIVNTVSKQRQQQDRNRRGQDAGHESPVSPQQAPEQKQPHLRLDRACEPDKKSRQQPALQEPAQKRKRKEQVYPKLYLSQYLRAQQRIKRK